MRHVFRFFLKKKVQQQQGTNRASWLSQEFCANQRQMDVRCIHGRREVMVYQDYSSDILCESGAYHKHQSPFIHLTEVFFCVCDFLYQVLLRPLER